MALQDKELAIKYKDEYLVVQSNDLVRAKQDETSLIEMKLIRLAISQITENQEEFNYYSIHVVDLAKFLGIRRENIYREVENISRRLMEKTITIYSGKKDKEGRTPYKIYHWVEKVEYKDGIITYKFNNEVREFLIGVREYFTSYEYRNVRKLKTVNSIRLFEILSSWQNEPYNKLKDTYYFNVPIEKNEVIFPVSYLRQIFNCETKYPNTNDFIRFIIDKSVKAINENTLMKVSYRTVKKDIQIVYVVFKYDDWKEETAEEKARRIRYEELTKQLFGGIDEDGNYYY